MDLGSALVGSFSDEFYLLDGVWTMRNVDMTKATGLSSQFAIVGDLQTITNLSANLIITGELQIGGGGQHMSLIKQFDALTGAVLTGLIGDDRQSPSNPSGSGFYGAWFKGPFGVGGTPAQPAFGTDSNGNAYFHNVQIDGSLIVGNPVPSARVAGTAATANTANSAASLSGTISCAQLQANTVAVNVGLQAPVINAGQIYGGSISIATTQGTVYYNSLSPGLVVGNATYQTDYTDTGAFVLNSTGGSIAAMSLQGGPLSEYGQLLLSATEAPANSILLRAYAPTATSANGGAYTPPATVALYLKIFVGGVQYKIPLYSN